MPNVAAVLKAEIARVARQQLKAELTPLKKALQAQRALVKKQRERIDAMQKELAALRRARPAAAAATRDDGEGDGPKRRFSPARLKALRQRLDLSAADFARVVGVSAQSVYGWERSLSRPAPDSLERIAQLRALSKRQVAQQLESLAAG